MPPTASGFALVLLAAIAGGGLALPLKKRRQFELENIYIPSTLVMMIVLPLAMAAVVVPSWTHAVRAAGSQTVWAGVAFGFGWGIGAVLFGYGVTMAGMSVGYATIMGINTAVGSILPFVVKSPADLLKPSGEVILAGILGCVLGVAVCGRAGWLRDRQYGQQNQGSRFGLALIVCVASGVLSSCANLGFSFTSRVGDAAENLGASPVFSTLASWIPVFWGAAGALLLWFGGMQIKRGTWRKNVGPYATYDWLMGVLMGAIWFLATIPYGMGAHFLGRLGTSAGWAINIACSLLVANIFGFLTGEWTKTSAVIRRTLYSGLSILAVAIVLLAIGSSMTTS
jgi:L-rhamnose-H+ transport protein